LTRKIIVVDEEIHKMLVNICDAALKWSGIQMLSAVNQVVGSVKEEISQEELFHFEEEEYLLSLN
jgi:hemerythrin